MVEWEDVIPEKDRNNKTSFSTPRLSSTKHELTLKVQSKELSEDHNEKLKRVNDEK